MFARFPGPGAKGRRQIMLSRNLEQTLHRALSFASDRRHEYATLEHLLLGLADDSDAATVLRACGVDLDKLRQDLTEFLDKDLSGLTTDRTTEPKPTAGFQRVVQRAVRNTPSPIPLSGWDAGRNLAESIDAFECEGMRKYECPALTCSART